MIKEDQTEERKKKVKESVKIDNGSKNLEMPPQSPKEIRSSDSQPP
jgi:hypothetical protein